jgi:hypothetical protein
MEVAGAMTGLRTGIPHMHPYWICKVGPNARWRRLISNHFSAPNYQIMHFGRASGIESVPCTLQLYDLASQKKISEFTPQPAYAGNARKQRRRQEDHLFAWHAFVRDGLSLSIQCRTTNSVGWTPGCGIDVAVKPRFRSAQPG